MPTDVAIYHYETQDHRSRQVLDRKLIERRKPALEDETPVSIELADPQRRPHRGAMLSGEIARRTATPACRKTPSGSRCTAPPARAFGAWVATGVTLDLVGEANDYVGKGFRVAS